MSILSAERTEDRALEDDAKKGVIRASNQSPGSVAITYEMVHDTRVIPLDGRPYVGGNIHLYLGDARGRWEGGTLVVDTTNLMDRTSISENGNGLRHSEAPRLVERFTRLDGRRSSTRPREYQATTDDPNTYTRPWTMSLSLTSPREYDLLRYDCHEGHHGLPNILSAERAEDTAVVASGGGKNRSAACFTWTNIRYVNQGRVCLMAIVDRVKNICLTPNTEWPIIADEPGTAGDLITGYAVPLAAIGAVAGFVGGSVIGRTLPFIGTYRVSLVAGLVGAVFSFVMAIVAVFVVSLIIDALAPSFGGEKNSIRALKVAVYSYTPAMVAGILNILPLLGVLVVIAALYGLYLLYLGLPSLMKCPQDKAIGYTVVVVICAIVINLCIVAVGGVIAGAGLIGAGALGGLGTGGLGGVGGLDSVTRRSAPASEVQFSKDSALGKLQELGKKMEESNKKIEAAQKSGDPSAAAAAAVEGLGTLFGGGRHVDPIGIDQLKPFVPEQFAGLPRTSSSAEKTGLAGLMVSKAQASYSDGAQKHVTLELSDTGGASGLLGLAGWVGLQGEKEDDDVSERTQKVSGRLIHEKVSKRGGSNEFAVVLGDRFVVSATGRGVDLRELKAAVAGLDLGKLESMKDVGVTK